MTKAQAVITEIEQTSIACPSQWEGRTADGRYVYIRYRHGIGTIGIGNTMDDAISNNSFSWMGAEDGACSLYDVETELIGSGVNREIGFADGVALPPANYDNDPDADEDFA